MPGAEMPSLQVGQVLCDNATAIFINTIGVLKMAKKKPAPDVKVRNIVGKLGRGECSRDERRALLDNAARKLLTKGGMRSLTRAAVAEGAKCSPGMVNNHYGTAAAMRAWAADDAVARKDVKVLARMHNDGFELPKMPRALRAECTAA